MPEKENSGVIHTFLKAYTGLMESLHRFEAPKSADNYKPWHFGHKNAPFTSDPVIYPDSKYNEEHYNTK